MSKKDVHILPNGENWGVKIVGNERISKKFNTQTEASAYGRERAIANGSGWNFTKRYLVLNICWPPAMP